MTELTDFETDTILRELENRFDTFVFIADERTNRLVAGELTHRVAGKIINVLGIIEVFKHIILKEGIGEV